jgi:hypothetical protein
VSGVGAALALCRGAVGGRCRSPWAALRRPTDGPALKRGRALNTDSCVRSERGPVALLPGPVNHTRPSRRTTSAAVDVDCGCQPELALLADPALLLLGFLLLALRHTVRRPRSLVDWTPGGTGHDLPLTSPACLGRRTTLSHAASPLRSRHAVRGAPKTVSRPPPAGKARAVSLGARGRTSTPPAWEARVTCGRLLH